MNNLKFPTSSDLASTIKIAMAGKTEQQFSDDYLMGVRAVLNKDPRQFRSYGVFWWAIKLAFNSRGINDFGIDVDATAIAHMNHLTEAECLCAAYINKQSALERGALYLCDHVYDGTDEQEYFYSLDDEELEEMIVGNI